LAQDQRYQQGRTLPGKIITNAASGSSWHQFGLAIDNKFKGPDPFLEGLRQSNAARADLAWQKFGELAKGYGFQWGGDFKLLKDLDHIQLTFGLTIQEVQELHRNGGLRGVWTYLDQITGQNTSNCWPDLTGL
jgi:peptidoglycan L-alanyl-D-glutamate endopeptidase CwlK